MRPLPDHRVPKRTLFFQPGWVVRLPVFLLGIAMATALAQDVESDDQLIRRELDEVLAQPEFSRLRVEPPPSVNTPDWLERFGDWIRNLLPDWNFDVRESGLIDFLKMIPTIVGVILVAGIIFLIIKLVNNWRSRPIEQVETLSSLRISVGSTPPGELPADEYLRRAQLAANNGIYSEAIAQLLLGTLSVTERAGLIRFRKGLTYRDYRRALRRIPASQEAFQQLCAIYLPVGFGRRSAGRDHFEEALRNYQHCVHHVERSQRVSPPVPPVVGSSAAVDSSSPLAAS